MDRDEHIEIAAYEDSHAIAFKQLNLEWLTTYGLLEPEDLKYLDNPRKVIIDPGGTILVAKVRKAIVGTCAIVKVSDSLAELAKFAVLPSTRGRGVGRMLALESIETARQKGFKTLFLVSNKQLAPAIRLYESLGFLHGPVPETNVYATADIYMELDITK